MSSYEENLDNLRLAAKDISRAAVTAIENFTGYPVSQEAFAAVRASVESKMVDHLLSNQDWTRYQREQTILAEERSKSSSTSSSETADKSTPSGSSLEDLVTEIKEIIRPLQKDLTDAFVDVTAELFKKANKKK